MLLIVVSGEGRLKDAVVVGVEVARGETAVLWRRCNRLRRNRSVDGREDGESAVRVVDAAESVEEGTVRVVDRSLLTTSEAVAVLELSKCGGRPVIAGG